MMNQIRIVLADDHSLMRMGLVALIASEPDMKVVGEAANGREAVERADALRPDIVIMDLMMPVLSGAGAAREIHDRHPDTGIIVLTSFAFSNEMAEAVRNGARAVLTKDAPTEELVRTIRAVHEGQTVLPRKIRSFMKEEAETSPLTARQIDILASVTRGLSNGDIAKQFGITEGGVKKHLQTIFAKIGASTRTEAAAIALRRQLLKIYPQPRLVRG